jgi:hypothetical protein
MSYVCTNFHIPGSSSSLVTAIKQKMKKKKKIAQPQCFFTLYKKKLP